MLKADFPSEGIAIDGCGWTPPIQLGVWFQVTVVKNRLYCSMYVDEINTNAIKLKGK